MQNQLLLCKMPLLVEWLQKCLFINTVSTRFKTMCAAKHDDYLKAFSPLGLKLRYIQGLRGPFDS